MMWGKILGYLDEWAHALHTPKWLQRRLCDALDRSIGVYDD